MESMRSTWTDSRLDDRNNRVGEMSTRLDSLGVQVDGLQHTMIHGFIAIMVAMFTGFVGLAGLILTQI